MKRAFPLLAAGAVSLALTVAAVAPAEAQTRRIAIGAFRSARSCTIYAVQSGRDVAAAARQDAAVAATYGAAVTSSSAVAVAREWRTDLYRDCIDDFTGIRQSVAAAFAGSGRFMVVPHPSASGLMLTGRVSGVGGSADTVRMAGVAFDRTKATITIDYLLADPRGRSVAGGTISKTVPLQTTTISGAITNAAGQSIRTVYAQLQRELALAMARSISFQLEPMRVTEVSPRHVRVNYGAPLLGVGATVLVTPAFGMSPIKCIVSSASAMTAVLDVDGSGDLGRVIVGSSATFVDADDPAIKSRRYERVDLP